MIHLDAPGILASLAIALAVFVACSGFFSREPYWVGHGPGCDCPDCRLMFRTEKGGPWLAPGRDPGHGRGCDCRDCAAREGGGA